ncbi:DUF3566 domain-containing protein [uncultured Bradyrhizobium sp.]|uniref:DUF3566 domain-containing protein n=1 Tax=uncultured Bradyrhizobium sp. TaxID=199684 RepID=UPI0034596681
MATLLAFLGFIAWMAACLLVYYGLERAGVIDSMNSLIGGVGGDQLGELLVLQIDQLLGRVAVGLVPERIDAQRLDVDALRVHGLEAVRAVLQMGRTELEVHHRQRFGKRAVRMDVDGLDAAAVDHDLAAACRGLRVHMRRVEHAAAAERDAGESAGGLAEEIPARGHLSPFTVVSVIR